MFSVQLAGWCIPYSALNNYYVGRVILSLRYSYQWLYIFSGMSVSIFMHFSQLLGQKSTSNECRFVCSWFTIPRRTSVVALCWNPAYAVSHDQEVFAVGSDWHSPDMRFTQAWLLSTVSAGIYIRKKVQFMYKQSHSQSGTHIGRMPIKRIAMLPYKVTNEPVYGLWWYDHAYIVSCSPWIWYAMHIYMTLCNNKQHQ